MHASQWNTKAGPAGGGDGESVLSLRVLTVSHTNDHRSLHVPLQSTQARLGLLATNILPHGRHWGRVLDVMDEASGST